MVNYIINDNNVNNYNENNNNHNNNNDNIHLENNILYTMLNFFNKPENSHLKEYVKNFDEPNGFSNCHSNEFIEICNGVDENSNLDSGIVLYLRKCQYIFIHE
jgi:hypothetical protein